jgi:D-alanyl-D-alanine carboxypeptidase/D-alanyl-D-alanine-endopeptidase (penicillin-binding protein 4)
MNSLKFLRLSFIFCILYFTFYISSCSVQKQVGRSATQLVIKDSSLLAAHVGISIYEPATNKYWYNYQGDKYFVPASNTKLPTCYAAMKYLGDSLVGLQYENIYDSVILIHPSGDPTLLQPDFVTQPVKDFLINNKKQITVDFGAWKDKALGSGWSWNDYNESYMAERSIMPIYGNLVTVNGTGNHWDFSPNIKGKIIDDGGSKYLSKVVRERASNIFHLRFDGTTEKTLTIPFNTEDTETIAKLLQDIAKNKVTIKNGLQNSSEKKFNIIHSQPTDSLLKITMHRSDNFFAEQILLMVSNEKLGYMNDEKIIDTLLKTDFKDLPQKPRWVDGSGLSRYNLFTPQDFVSILNKIKNEFGMERIKVILPTGGTGTISGYYKADSNYIFAKTGTLGGVVALSGYLYTKKNKLLIFSVLVNNHQASATAVRKAVERFIEGVRDKY